jgi:hypothetical protein
LFEATSILLASTLALYLGVIYVFSFSMDTPYARYAINVAVLIMDAVIVWQFVRRYAGPHGPSRHNRTRWRFEPVCRAAASGLFLCVVLLHADYALARLRYKPAGLTASVEIIKVCLLFSQLLLVVAIALTVRPQSPPTKSPFFRLDAADVLPLSVVLVPLVHYLAYNRTLFSFTTAVEYLAFFLLCALALFLVVQFLERALDAPTMAAPLAAGLALLYYSMPMVSSALRSPVESLFWVHFGLAATIPLGLATMYCMNRNSMRKAMAIFAAFSVCASVIQAATQSPGEGTPSLGYDDSDQAELAELLSRRATRTPDVYLLVYDALAPSEMMARYGIDDRPDTAYLTGNGFKIYDGSYSLFLSSKRSLGSVLDMRVAPRTAIGGPTTAARFFREHGYRTHLILSSYMLQGANPTAVDFMFPSGRSRWDLAAMYRGIGGGQFKPQLVFHDSDRNRWISTKRSVLAASSGPPRMMYAHSMLPGHSELTGGCLPDEAARYAARLLIAREEMRGDIEATLSSHRDAIIIVAGDHGPYLTGDCTYMNGYQATTLTAEHLADRYAARLAIRWPGKVSDRIDQINVLQDVFFAVSAYVLNDDRIWLHRLSAVTFGHGGIPDGAVNEGRVMIGPDQGSPLLGR